jgi:hexokinase
LPPRSPILINVAVSNLTSFALSDTQLEQVQEALAVELRLGLKAQEQKVAVLPTYFSVPTAQRSGQCLAIDCGGTNIRAALVECTDNGEFKILAGPVEAKVPPSHSQTPSNVFFDKHVELVHQLGDISCVPVGYCFSYPSKNTVDGDAELLHWTKGLQFKDMVGTMVGTHLKNALNEAGVPVNSIRVLNDTVAALFSRPVLRQSTCIGLIVGTGFNIATFARGEQIKKCADWPSTEMMALNLESGNFCPPGLTSFDHALDAASNNQGAQRYEKAVSGLYLPELFARTCPGAVTCNNGGDLVALRDRDPSSHEGQWAGAILKRSADLVASGLAAVVDVFGPLDRTSRCREVQDVRERPLDRTSRCREVQDVRERPTGAQSKWPVEILAEGGLFWGDPKYALQVKIQLERRLGSGYSLSFRHTENANIIGAARAALA